MIEVLQWNALRPVDRIIATHNGVRRVALVDSWVGDGRLRVRLHKRERLGFCCGTICIRRSASVEVTQCRELNIKVSHHRVNELLEAVGGAA